MSAEAADIVIIGAGLAGAATAYHLARPRFQHATDDSTPNVGARSGRSRSTKTPRVILLEKEPLPGMHSSGRNAAFIRELMDDRAMQPLGTEGAEVLRRGELCDFRRCGLMLVGMGEEDVAARFPAARGRGLWNPHDGIADVAALLQTYLAGQDLRCETRVQGWRPEGDRLRVVTSRGEFTCRILVNAGGPWAGRVGGLPLTPLKRHLVQTPPMPGIRADWPFVWHARDGLYFRPESGGLLLSPCDQTPSEPGDYAEDAAAIEDLAEKVARLQPELGDLSILRSWAGQRTFAPDRRFVIGFDPREPRLFHVAGLGGHGVTTSYAVGRLAASLILAGVEPPENPFSPARTIHQA
ncbi:MAG: FAD-dependent catabolic D-arginine dehydrogenase DauA [Phycisphaerae bacterium]|nr:FAD-dependent catabolic D-arginine dehydrogenase DauA [Phycisphaerae bacterium]